LRTLLGEWNALISGSFALQLFLSEYWPGSDLNIFVEQGAGMDALDEHLRTREHYVLESEKNKDCYAMFDLVQVSP
jgi:hypothetical protein